MKYTDTNKPLVCMQTQSNCYKNTRTMDIKGVLWHCTGANNPNLKRYVQPKDSSKTKEHTSNTYTNAEWLNKLGYNNNGNDYNHDTNQTIWVGMNCWIGKLADGTVTTVQTMPWNYIPWGVATGYEPCNNGWIQFEICEDGLTDVNYFNKIYQEACEITAYLCKLYNINPKGTVNVNGKAIPTVLCHYDSYRYGLGSNHSDVYNWFNNFGKTMDHARSDVASLLAGITFSSTSEPTEPPETDENFTQASTPIKPIEPILVQELSIVGNSFNSAVIKIYTSDFFNKYSWYYTTRCLIDDVVSAEHRIIVSSRVTEFSITGLNSNSYYKLTLIAKDSNGNKTIIPGLVFSTQQSYPEAVKNVTFKMAGKSIPQMTCQVSFNPPSYWGEFNAANKGYRLSLIVNGFEKGYSDTFITTANSSKNFKLIDLLSHLKTEPLQYNDIIQISILPWVKDTQNNYIFSKEGARYSKPIQLSHSVNINIINKIYLKTFDGFKQLILFNFSK